MPEYWVYENWTHKRARMHKAACSFCNHGRGMQVDDSGRNGRWLGPFQDRELASKALQGTGQFDRASCAVCGA
jgi:F-type H+/Na+-transporting ATPase subunit beta